MEQKRYFLINDTRFDNHHGCLRVIRNLHLAMSARGWQCVGSLPVSSSVSDLKNCKRELALTDLIVVNGEGSLHHDSRNANRLFAICERLVETHPVALINALWQDNETTKWQSVLERLKVLYARDRRSQNQLKQIVEGVGYAPDLTFYEYERFYHPTQTKFLCTDSVVNLKTEQLLELTTADDSIDLMTMFTGRLEHMRGIKDWDKWFKYRLYPPLWNYLKISVPSRYKVLTTAVGQTDPFLEKMATYRAVCVARYHALCFVVQQRIPFVAVASNSYKSEALLAELNLPRDKFLLNLNDTKHLKNRLEEVFAIYSQYAEQIEDFNTQARSYIDEMFDCVTV